MGLEVHGLIKLEVLVALRLLVQQVRKVGRELLRGKAHVCVVGNRVEAKLGVWLHHEVLLALDW